MMPVRQTEQKKTKISEEERVDRAFNKLANKEMDKVWRTALAQFKRDAGYPADYTFTPEEQQRMVNLHNSITLERLETCKSLIIKLKNPTMIGNKDKSQIHAYAKAIFKDLIHLDQETWINNEDIRQSLLDLVNVLNKVNLTRETKTMHGGRAIYFPAHCTLVLEGKSAILNEFLSRGISVCAKAVVDGEEYIKVDKGAFDIYIERYCSQLAESIRVRICIPTDELRKEIVSSGSVEEGFKNWGVKMCRKEYGMD